MITLEKIWKRLSIHWIMTVKAIAYAVLLVMYWQGKIDTQEWILATGSIMVINSLFQKDPDKTMSKPGL